MLVSRPYTPFGNPGNAKVTGPEQLWNSRCLNVGDDCCRDEDRHGTASAHITADPDRTEDCDAIVDMAMDVRDFGRKRLDRDRAYVFSMTRKGVPHRHPN